MSFKVSCLSFLIFMVFMVHCKPNEDPDSEVESLNLNKPEENLKVILENTLQMVEREASKLRSELRKSQNTMADEQGSDARIQNLLTMREKIANLTATLLEAVKPVKEERLLG